MATDWEKIRYEFDLYRKTRAFKRHAAIVIGAVVLTIAVLVTRWALTSRGPAAAIKKAAAEPRSPVPQELRGPSEFVGSLDSRLSADPRFAGRIIAVPTLISGPRPTSRVMIQGQLTSDGDLAALRDVVRQLKPPVPIDWQVVIVEPRR